ncbi:hypothetical protein [Micromonospora sp. NPDC049662]|uniref:hypothetical protein n=1 Tax=Micromonospora sp. NPDC049662 TaxID=3155397 RepID=UPI00342B7DFA
MPPTTLSAAFHGWQVCVPVDARRVIAVRSGEGVFGSRGIGTPPASQIAATSTKKASADVAENAQTVPGRGPSRADRAGLLPELREGQRRRGVDDREAIATIASVDFQSIANLQGGGGR